MTKCLNDLSFYCGLLLTIFISIYHVASATDPICIVSFFCTGCFLAFCYFQFMAKCREYFSLFFHATSGTIFYLKSRFSTGRFFVYSVFPVMSKRWDLFVASFQYFSTATTLLLCITIFPTCCIFFILYISMNMFLHIPCFVNCYSIFTFFTIVVIYRYIVGSTCLQCECSISGKDHFLCLTVIYVECILFDSRHAKPVDTFFCRGKGIHTDMFSCLTSCCNACFQHTCVVPGFYWQIYMSTVFSILYLYTICICIYAVASVYPQ